MPSMEDTTGYIIGSCRGLGHDSRQALGLHGPGRETTPQVCTLGNLGSLRVP